MLEFLDPWILGSLGSWVLGSWFLGSWFLVLGSWFLGKAWVLVLVAVNTNYPMKLAMHLNFQFFVKKNEI
jgi:hypothetical protein